MPEKQKAQAYNDGWLAVYRVKEPTAYGRVTADDLELVDPYRRYADRKLGMTRFFTGYAAGQNIEKVVRVPLRRGHEMHVNDVVLLLGASAKAGVYYTIRLSQPDTQNGWEDLTLEVLQVDQG